MIPASDASAARPQKPARTKARRVRWTFFVGLAVIVLCVPVVAASTYGFWLVKKTVATLGRVKGLTLAPEVEGQPVTYLVIGSDARDAPQFAADTEGPDAVSGQRSDVIILIVLDPRRPDAVVLSIPRDTRVDIPDVGTDKINAAYNDGPQKVIDTVKQFTGLPINHYIDVGFLGFMRLVDAVGTVPLCTDRTLKDDFTGLYLPAGCHDLNGGAALPFVRSRHTLIEQPDGSFEEDPTGDFGRIQRQQQFLRALFAKAAKPGNLTRFPSFVAAVSDTIRTDTAFTDGDAVSLGRRFLRYDPNKIFMVSLPGAVPQDIGGVSFVVTTDATDAFLAALREGRPLPGEPGRGVQLTEVDVVVTNGTALSGCGQAVADRLSAAGAHVVDVGTAPKSDVAVTEVRYNPGDKAKADVVRAALGLGKVVELNRPGNAIDVVVGADASKLCPS